MPDPRRIFYNDLSDAEAAKWISELRPQVRQAQLTPTLNAAYRYLPSTYMFCENDQALPIGVQGEMVAESGASFAKERCESGHSPYLSMPGKVVEVLQRIVEGLKLRD